MLHFGILQSSLSLQSSSFLLSFLFKSLCVSVSFSQCFFLPSHIFSLYLSVSIFLSVRSITRIYVILSRWIRPLTTRKHTDTTWRHIHSLVSKGTIQTKSHFHWWVSGGGGELEPGACAPHCRVQIVSFSCSFRQKICRIIG